MFHYSNLLNDILSEYFAASGLRTTSKALRWQDGFSRPAWNWC